ncbi:P-II family nitrogen regulator [Actinomycetaceae bacterium MB13-C1-2]|nr:P-II family nitrogen regulator [Actinomycetaceae bacterium MB13-C1-2]
MKLITAVIQPTQVASVRQALAFVGLNGATITGVSGIGQQKGHSEYYRGANYNPAMIPKIKVETLVADELLEEALSAIVTAAHTGNIGDGKVWVTNVEEVIRVRTGERGPEAL